MSWCNWCDIKSCPNVPWNKEVVDWIIENLIKVMPCENKADKRAILKRVKEELKDRDLWIKTCSLCIKVDQFVEKVKLNTISITLL